MSTENEVPQSPSTPDGETPVVAVETTVAAEATPATPEAGQPQTNAQIAEEIIKNSGTGADDDATEADRFNQTTPAPNVTVANPEKTLRPWPNGEFPPERLALLMATAEEFRTRVVNWKNLEWGNDPITNRWVVALRDSMSLFAEGRSYIDLLAKELSDYHQSIDVGDTALNIAAARLGDVVPGRKLTGEAAQQRMMQSLRMGSMVAVPLFHSGIWVTLKAPPESDLLALEEQLIEEKISLGRDTGGRTHGAQGVFALARVIDTVLNNVYEASTESYDPSYLKTIIRQPDLHPLILGFLSAIYPAGYPMSRACIADPASCKHVTEEVVNLPRLLFLDRNALTDKQKAHMRQRNKRFTADEIKAYQDEFRFQQKAGTIKINDSTLITVRVPTLADSEMSGREWIAELLNNITDQAENEMDDVTRDRRLNTMALTQATRQYAAWVEKITLDKTEDSDGEIIDERGDVATNIGFICGNDEYAKRFYEGMDNYISQCTMGLVAIPNYKCPKCGGEQATNEDLRRHPHLIALDTVQTFFTLLRLRGVKIRARRLN